MSNDWPYLMLGVDPRGIGNNLNYNGHGQFYCGTARLTDRLVTTLCRNSNDCLRPLKHIGDQTSSTHTKDSQQLFPDNVPRQRRRSSSRRHAFLPPVTALSPTWNSLSRSLTSLSSLASFRRRLTSCEVFLTSTALPTISSDRYSVLTLRRTRVLSLF